jgi:hypothetical protein
LGTNSLVAAFNMRTESSPATIHRARFMGSP